MVSTVKIPMFPLTLFPLPGELVPLHIFEPRYKQLIAEVEKTDISFGIFCNHTMNEEKLGSLVKLESVLKRYPGGELDIIVRCVDLFNMNMLLRKYKDKPYPGGEVNYWKLDQSVKADRSLKERFFEYLQLLNITKTPLLPTIYDVANELNMELSDRLKFAQADEKKRTRILKSRLTYQSHLLKEAIRFKDTFQYN